MRMRRNLLALAAAVAFCLVAAWLCTSTKGSPKTYEVQPWITVPEYRTDAARAIDAYERLMDRYMDLTERNLFSVGCDIRDAVKKLDSIDDKLTHLCARIARIEDALGIEPPVHPVEGTAQSVPSDRKPTDEPSALSVTD